MIYEAVHQCSWAPRVSWLGCYRPTALTRKVSAGAKRLGMAISSNHRSFCAAACCNNGHAYWGGNNLAQLGSRIVPSQGLILFRTETLNLSSSFLSHLYNCRYHFSVIMLVLPLIALATSLATASAAATEYQRFFWPNSTQLCPGMIYKCRPPNICAYEVSTKKHYCCNPGSKAEVCWLGSASCAGSGGAPTEIQQKCSFGDNAYCCLKDV